jgi:glycerol-3-phosphate acyltransferase PlsY
VGSRNIGATNAYRELGARWGILVFLLDAAKGVLATFVPFLIAPWSDLDLANHANLLPALDTVFMASLAAGVAAILGHMFSPWLGFRGGRGVATSLGVFLSIVPTPTLLAFGLWTALVLVTRRVSPGSIGAALAYPFLVFLLLRGHPHRILLTAIAGAVALLVILRHKSNIQRLLAGTEPPFLGRRRGDAS